MMKMMIMINCFSETFEQQKGFSLISSREHCSRSSISRISDTSRAGFEPAVSLILGLVEWSCAEVILTRLLENLVKILQLRVSFQISMVSCCTFIMDHTVQFRWTSYIQWFHHGSSTLEHDTIHKNLNFGCKEVHHLPRAWFSSLKMCIYSLTEQDYLIHTTSQHTLILLYLHELLAISWTCLFFGFVGVRYLIILHRLLIWLPSQRSIAKVPSPELSE